MRAIGWSIIVICLVAASWQGFQTVVKSAKAAASEVRIVTDPKIEKRVEKLEAAVKTIEEHLQRKGSRY